MGHEVGADVVGRRRARLDAHRGDRRRRELGLRAVAQVDGGLAHARARRDRVHRHARVAVLGQLGPRRGEDRIVDARRARTARRPAGTLGTLSSAWPSCAEHRASCGRRHFFTSLYSIVSAAIHPRRRRHVCRERHRGLAHHAQVDLVSSQPKRVLIVVANPGVSTTLGWPVGFWAAELTHPVRRAHRARRRGDDREPGRGQGRVRRLQRPPRRVEVVLRGPHHDGLHQHAGTAWRCSRARRSSPTSTSTTTTR